METPVSDPLPEYEKVAEALRRSGMPQCPAELHGFALGMVIGGVREPLQVWQQEVYAEFDPNDVLDNEILAAYKPLGVEPYDPSKVAKIDGPKIRIHAL